MIKILKKTMFLVGQQPDYILEDGAILYPFSWNGEYYDYNNQCYYPVYAAVYEDDTPIQWDIIGFTIDRNEAYELSDM